MPNAHSSAVTRVFRIIRMVIHTLYGMIIATLLLPRANPRQRDAIISGWSTSLLTLLNVRVVTRGNLPGPDVTSTMFVANHISWVDIHALNTVRAVRFIAKSEVRGWPVFGWFAQKSNTLFIDRSKKQDAGRIVEVVTESLNAGDCLCYFPEGTTTDGTELKAFKGSILQAAINTESMVWPFTVRYPNADGSANTDMAYWGEMSLVDSIWLVLSQRSPVVELEFLPQVSPRGHERRGLTILVRNTIAGKLNLPHE
ncbi:MAG TPA: lysophospholipid acyltransferase family protein [Methylophilaceae bacterium]|nr:lysophospholipid acyltransferase family protein [Methylophilaceae bacterium]